MDQGRQRCCHDDFVVLWQIAKDIDEVIRTVSLASDFSVSRQNVMRRAAKYRRLGVRLKKM